MKTLLAYSPVPIPEKRLHARHIQTFTQAANRTAEAFLKQPSEKALLDFLLLPRVLGIAYKNSQIPATLKAYPRTRPDPPAPLPPQANPSLPRPIEPIQQATKWLEKGYVGKAARALYDSAPLAPREPGHLGHP